MLTSKWANCIYSCLQGRRARERASPKKIALLLKKMPRYMFQMWWVRWVESLESGTRSMKLQLPLQPLSHKLCSCTSRGCHSGDISWLIEWVVMFISPSRWALNRKPILYLKVYQIRWDQSLSRVRLFVTPWITARQASLSITNFQSSLKLTSIESAMPSSHLILCRSLFLLPPIPPSIRVFSNESTLRMKWPKY